VYNKGRNGGVDMSVIYKYELTQERTTIGLEMPIDSKVLKVAVVNDKVYLWALIPDKDSKTEYRSFKIFGTGWDIPRPDMLDHLGTVFIGNFVWHIFEQKLGIN
jgi:hypothetical protein